jgi:N-acetylmuramoyl-L-alanine amidase
MASQRLQRVKRKVLREVVQENVADLKGTLGRRRRTASRRRLLRDLAIVALPVGLFTTYLLASMSGVSGPIGSSGVRGLLPPAESASGPVAPGTAPASWPPIDGVTVPADEVRPLSREAFPLPVRKIVLDPGHGGINSGASGPDGLLEKDLTLDISLRLEKLLLEEGFAVDLTRRGDEAISLEQRADFANRERGDIFVSVHLNWIDIREIRGIETFYLGPTDDPYLTELAASENRGSGYSLADFKQLVEQVYANARQDDSKRLAAEVQRSLYSALRRISPNLRDRGVKRAPFVVLTGTEMPAILAEVSCLSNEDEARLLKLPEYRDYIAEALFQGVHTYARRVTGGIDWGT